MVTTVGKHSNQSELLVKGRKMKLKVLNGRTFSTMITDYDRKVLWMLAPIGRQYMEYDLSAMGRSVPQFFHPEVKINKKKIAKEMVGDRKAIKYAAEVTSPGSARVFDGFLWIAESLPDYPLKWQDPEYQLTVDWQDAKLVELDDSLFALPEGYLKVEPPKPGADVAGHQGQHRPESTAAEKKD
ncbi:MAG: hypothetical protein KKG70_12965 [Proteobacteria bacterium]|nr:hypothetical protein [Pseudomonadota bacterium]